MDSATDLEYGALPAEVLPVPDIIYGTPQTQGAGGTFIGEALKRTLSWHTSPLVLGTEQALSCRICMRTL